MPKRTAFAFVAGFVTYRRVIALVVLIVSCAVLTASAFAGDRGGSSRSPATTSR